MKKLYEKSQLNFFLLWLLIYIGIQNLGQSLGASLESGWYVAGPCNLLLGLFLYFWVKKNGLCSYYRLGKLGVSAKKLLWFLPLILLSTDNLWGGIRLTMSPLALLSFLVGMAAVGFLEELLVRGFLFQYLKQESRTQAVVISTLAFSAAHILNLFTGRLNFMDCLLQLVFALVLGLLYALMLLKSGSLWPCVFSHSAINMLSAFADRDLPLDRRLPLNLICILIAGAYTWYLSRQPDAE